MRKIGLIGGMSWESTAVYYRLMNEAVRTRLGGLHSAQLILWSFDFDEIAKLQSNGDWQTASEQMVAAGRALQAAGAEAIVICTNTMHKLAPALENQVSLPLLHIADATADAIQQSSFQKVGLLATRFTMEQDFYITRMQEKFGIEAIVPEPEDRLVVHDIIYNELCKGIVQQHSKQRYLEIIGRLQHQGAQAVILGCTEIGLLLQETDSTLPLFDSTALHAEAAVNWSLSN